MQNGQREGAKFSESIPVGTPAPSCWPFLFENLVAWRLTPLKWHSFVRPLWTGEYLPLVTVSGEIAALQTGDTLMTLLDRADAWIYAAKADGWNRVWPAMKSSMSGVLALTG